MKPWKKLALSISMFLTILITAFVSVGPAFAHHVTKVDQANCQGTSFVYSVSGAYVGGSSLRKVDWNVNVTIDGNTTNYSGSWEGTSNGFSLFSVSGTANSSVQTSGQIVMSEWQKVKGKWQWVEIQTETYGLNKTNTCIPTQKITYGKDSNCQGWWGWYKVNNGSPITYASGLWTNPYTLEPITIPAFNLTPPVGQKYDLSQIPAQSLTEKADCQQQHKVTYTSDSNCDSWWTTYSIDGGSPTTYASGLWSDLYTLESASIPTYSLTAPAGEVYDLTSIPASTITEKSGCQKAREVRYDIEAGCKDWSAWYQVDGGEKVVYASGVWLNPFGLETGNADPFSLTVPAGEIYNLTTIPAQTVQENTDCQQSHTVNYGVESKCDGWSAWYQVDSGEVIVYASGTWSDPYTIEPPVSIPAYSLTVPAGEIYNLTTIPATSVSEPGTCQALHRVTYDSDANCSGWAAWYSVDGGSPITYASGLWSDPYTTETANFSAYPLTAPDGQLYDIAEIPSGSETEPSDCQQEHIITSDTENGCEGWSAWYQIDGGEKVVYASGSWSDIYNLETAEVSEFSVTVGDQTLTVSKTTIYETEECLQDKPRIGDPYVEMKCRIDELTGKPVVDLTIYIENALVDAGSYGILDKDTVLLAVPEGNYNWTWTAKEGYSGSGVLSVIVTATCKAEQRSTWKAVCKNNCGAERWETTGGVTTWKSNDLYGKDPEGILVVAGVNDDCVITAKGCVNTTIKYIVDKVEQGSFTVYDRSREFRPTVITDAWGQKWNLFVGYTITCFDNKNTKTDECGKILPDIELKNGFGTMYNIADNGWDMIPDDKDTFVHPIEFPCNLAPADWMTQMVDGKQVAFKLPGVSGNDWRIYLFKKGILPWPAGWPEAPVKGAWDKRAYPLEDANTWQAKLMDPKKHQWEWYLEFPTAK